MLSDFDPYDFESTDALRRHNFQKWNGAIDMWQSGIRSIDVALLDSDNESEIITALEKFNARNKNIGNDRLVIRFDHPFLPPNRSGATGIRRDDFAKIIETVHIARRDGWMPSAWIFAGNRECVRTIGALSFIGDGFVADFMPTGFESHDITKSLFNPGATVRTKSFAPALRIIADDIENMYLYLDFYFKDPTVAAMDRVRRIATCAKFNGIGITEQTEIFHAQNPRFFDGFLDLSPTRVAELIKIAADFADFYKLRGFKLENTTIGLDMLPNGHWFLVNLYNEKKFG